MRDNKCAYNPPLLGPCSPLLVLAKSEKTEKGRATSTTNQTPDQQHFELCQCVNTRSQQQRRLLQLFRLALRHVQPKGLGSSLLREAALCCRSGVYIS